MSGGRITLAIYIAIGLIPVCVGPAAVGQSRQEQANTPAIKGPMLPKYEAPPPAEINRVLPQYAIIRREERGYAPWTAREATPGKEPETVVIRYGAGGRMDAHYALYTDYRRAKTKVEVRGPCYSACTLVLAYVEEICIAEGAFMAFHAVRSKETGVRMDWETALAYRSMPASIKAWIDDNGGHDKLPLNGYWTLYDRQMWAMGYPKCQ